MVALVTLGAMCHMDCANRRALKHDNQYPINKALRFGDRVSNNPRTKK